jgi:uncharacterized protein with NRDE domain
MCLIVCAYDCHPDYQLILGANRDEYRDRPAEPARFWNSTPQILAGRDVPGGGTWMGVTTSGKVAAITNYRDPHTRMVKPPSRGKLVSDFLEKPDLTPQDYRAVLNRTGHGYDGFNLLYGAGDELYYFTNRGGSSGPISPGIHGLSNHLLDTRWPKVNVAQSRLESILQHKTIDPEQIFAALSDPLPFADPLLPDTGIGLERERMLSPLFINGSLYGTRSSTIVMMHRNGTVSFIERLFDDASHTISTRNFAFQSPAASR